MAPVQQSGEDSWSVVCAACCHMTLVFAVMHFYNILEFFIASVHSFFYTFLKSGIDNGMVRDTSVSQPYVLFQQG